MVPVTFTEENGEIWAYVTRMSSHDRPTGYVCVQYDHGEWKLRQEREELVLINTCRRKRTASGSPEAEWRRSRASFL